MLGEEKFEIRPMGRGFGQARTGPDPEDLRLCEQAWNSAARKSKAANTIWWCSMR